MNKLRNTLFTKFVEMYQDKNYLSLFHNRNMDIIKLGGYEIYQEDNKEYVLNDEGKKLYIPSLFVKKDDQFLKLNLIESNENENYLIR